MIIIIIVYVCLFQMLIIIFHAFHLGLVVKCCAIINILCSGFQSTGRAWDWFQRRRGYYKTQPINLWVTLWLLSLLRLPLWLILLSAFSNWYCSLFITATVHCSYWITIGYSVLFRLNYYTRLQFIIHIESLLHEVDCLDCHHYWLQFSVHIEPLLYAFHCLCWIIVGCNFCCSCWTIIRLQFIVHVESLLTAVLCSYWITVCCSSLFTLNHFWLQFIVHVQSRLVAVPCSYWISIGCSSLFTLNHSWLQFLVHTEPLVAALILILDVHREKPVLAIIYDGGWVRMVSLLALRPAG